MRARQLSLYAPRVRKTHCCALACLFFVVKWKAWKDLKSMAKEKAMRKYVSFFCVRARARAHGTARSRLVFIGEGAEEGGSGLEEEVHATHAGKVVNVCCCSRVRVVLGHARVVLGHARGARFKKNKSRRRPVTRIVQG